MAGKKMSRRDFVAAGSAFGVLGSQAVVGAPQVVTRSVRPVVICTENGPQSIPLEPLLS